MTQLAGALEIQMFAGIARITSDMQQIKGVVGGTMKNIESAVASAKSALGALGVGLSLNYFKNLIEGAINAMDHLHDLSKSTAITVENLAGLSLLAKQTGTDLDGLAKGINRMSVEMGKDPEKFARLGVTAKDNTKAFMQLADIFNSLTNVQQRNALAQAIFSKSWAELAPAMSEGSRGIADAIEKGKLHSKITEEMTKKADELNDKWAELVGTGGALNAIVGTMLDPLLKITNQMIAARDGATGFIDALRRFFSIGGDQASNPEKALEGVIQKLAELRKEEETFAGMGLIKRIFSADDIAIVRAQIADLERQKSMLEGLLGAPFPKPDAPGAKESAEAAKRAKAFLDADKAAKDEDATYRNLVKTLKEKLLVDHELTEVNKLQLSIDALSAKQLATITPERKAELEDLARQVDLKNQAKRANEAYAKSEEQLSEMRKEAAEALARVDTERGQAIMSIEKMIDQAKFETNLLGMTNVERQVAIALRTLETSGIDKQSASYEQLGKRLREAVGDNARMTEMKAEWERLWSVVEDTGKQAFTLLMSQGTNAFKAIGQALKTAVIDLLYQLTVRRWIINIGASVSGALGIPGAANAAGSSLNLLSTGASMYGNLGSAGAYAGGYASTAFASEATTAALIESGTTGVAGAGMEAGASGALAGMGPYGWIALAAIAAYLYFEGEGGGPKREDMFGMRNTTGDWWIGDNNISNHPGQAAYDAHAAFLKRIETTYGRDALNAMDLAKINISAEPGTGYAAIWAEFQRQAIALTKDLVPLTGQVKMTADAAADASAVLAIANTKRQMEIALLEAQGDATGALAERRKDERAALDVSLQALYDQIIAAQDLAEAETQLAAVRQSVVDDLATIQRERADTALAAMNDARGAVWDAYDTETQKLEDFAAGFREFSSSLAGARNALTLSPGFGLSPEDRYAEATRQAQDLLRRGQLGDLTAMQGFRDFAGTFLGTSSAYNASGVGFQADKAWILAGFDSLQGVADRQTSIAEEQLSGVRQTVEQLVGIRAGVLSLVDAMAVFTGARDTFQRDANRAGGNLSAGAAGALYDIESQARGQRLSGINALYRDIFGREGDVAGLSFYATSGRSLAQIEAEMRDMRAHGSHAAGLEFVPFDNYRANLHYGERVQTRTEADADRRGAMSDPKIVEHLATLTRQSDALIRQNGAGLAEVIASNQRLEKRMAAIEDNGALAAARR